jgi:AcrR family transcriptional regulator
MMPAALHTLPQRKPFRHAGEEARRAALIAAALDCMAEGGLPAATVRAIADRAGVTQGLIRHYFPSKDDLLAAAYQVLMDRLTGEAEAALAAAPADPVARLGAFVRAVFGPEATDARLLAAWAGFVGALHRSPELRAIHEGNYLGFRTRLERLVAAALAARGRAAAPDAVRRHAIAINAVLDGLWLEGGLLPEAFGPGELAGLGLAATAAILELDLAASQGVPE